VEPEDHAAADVGPGVFDGRTETCKVNQWSVLSVVGVGKVNSCQGHLVELLAVPRDGVRQVDDVHDLGAAEAGDLHSTHPGRLRGSGYVPTSTIAADEWHAAQSGLAQLSRRRLGSIAEWARGSSGRW
jgi:hypothetical protein